MIIQILFLTILLYLADRVFSPLPNIMSMFMVALLGFVGAMWILGSDKWT